MIRKSDLEQNIRDSYQLNQQYEDMIRLSSDPKEKARAQRAIKEQSDHINRYLAEYMSLCQQRGLSIPDDIVEVAIGFGFAIPAASSAESVPEPPVDVDPRADEFRYDAFISYSHHDKEWAQGWLLSSLETAAVQVCIDFRDFEPGAPSLTEMERAVLESRKTLLVLTPDYLVSEWTEFENILAQTLDPAARRRVLPLLLKPCELPLRISALTYLDFTNPENTNFQLDRLVTAIRR